jgi:hypothetical protein
MGHKALDGIEIFVDIGEAYPVLSMLASPEKTLRLRSATDMVEL